ncbi:30S ribosomal protein S18 [Bienertia sinuspersici]
MVFFSHGNDENKNANASGESVNDFESRIFGGLDDVGSSNSFYRRLDRIEKARYGQGNDSYVGGQDMFGLDGSHTSLLDGMEGRLKDAAKYFEFNPDEITQEDYTFRTDMNFKSGMTYTPEDLNLQKPGVWKPSKRAEFQVTTEEVLKKADFRNVRFLANFLTEAGIIIKRSKTGISAKAQRKVAREIKIARAFGLLPFTTMGTKQYIFGKTMEDLDEDFQLDGSESQAGADDTQDPVA